MIRPPSAAVVDKDDNLRQLVAPKGPDRQITEERVQDTKELTRLLQDAMRDLAQLERRPCPRRIDFEDIEVSGDGITIYRFPHGFGGRVRWWVVDCLVTDGTLKRSEGNTSDDTLALISNSSGTVTIRIEEVGG